MHECQIISDRMIRLSKGPQATGSIKNSAEDFRVEEITETGVTLLVDKIYTKEEIGGKDAEENKKFTRFVMQKKNWNTASALREITNRVGRGIKSAGFAGSKDRTAVSTQLCSIFGVRPEQLSSLRIKDIAINGAWEDSDKVQLGDLLGNRFVITVKDVKNAERIGDVERELGGLFPNYYGSQRFGIRDNNFDVGLAIMKGDFEKAAMSFLTAASGETNQEANDARARLAKEGDFSDAMDYFPKYLKYERLLLEYLSRYPTDFANAIRRMPRAITLMFVHSVESRIFNMEIERRIADHRLSVETGDIVCGANSYGFPDIESCREYSEPEEGQFLVANIVGYDTKSPNDCEKQILDGLDIRIDDFRIKSMPELNCKGTHRVLFAPYREFMFEQRDETAVVGFSLPSGSYATVLASEFLSQA